jgi:hypothetical protein
VAQRLFVANHGSLTAPSYSIASADYISSLSQTVLHQYRRDVTVAAKMVESAPQMESSQRQKPLLPGQKLIKLFLQPLDVIPCGKAQLVNRFGHLL